MILQVSVIICAHNPRPAYLRRVLGALKQQTLSSANWELLLVDNRSDAPLASAGLDLSWHPHTRHVREDELGLAWARLRGMQEAAGPLLVFVDDDNLLAPNYLEQSLQISREWPMLGVWGSGMIVPEFEVLPPDELQDCLGMLPLREIAAPRWSNVMPCYPAMPWGAGQCVRADVAAAYCKYFKSSAMKVSGRTGATLDSGEDLEIDFIACSEGFGVGIFPELRLVHLMPKERLSVEYLGKLAGGIAGSLALLEYKFQQTVPKSPLSGILGMPRVVKRMLTKRRVARRVYLAQLRAIQRARAKILSVEHKRV